MTLSVFIREHKDEITREWIEYAQNNIDGTHQMNLDEVTDHVREILDRISEDMETSQTDDQQEIKSKGNKEMTSNDRKAATAHGEQRLEFGFDFMQLSSEFRALRASVLRLWAKKIRDENWETDFYDMVRFNEAVDEIWMVSMDRFQNKLDESKNLFLGILGYDLRNPIATVKGAISILSLSKKRTEDEKKVLRLSQSSLKQMTGLIDNLLELTELKLGTGMPINKSSYDLQEQLEEIVLQLQLGYPKSRIVLDAPQPVKGQWDIQRIDQMMTNLIINAIRHGEAEGNVCVKLAEDSNDAVISVHNEGSPIPEEIQKKMFTGGFSANKGNARHGKGFGLGLLIVKEIVEGHDGEISVESNRKEGTIFTIRLPLKLKG